MVEIPAEHRDLVEKLKQEVEDNSVIIVLSKEEANTLRTMIKDREAFGRVFTWLIYMAGGIATIFGGWAVIQNFWSK